ncbi:hypothetical protein KI688_003919 [Linnemannia hyalina]|uniref:F-box domain-containing protein n=1 Tax=Linnemannia hyalina TaxID=64524 RepID=A0A9P8BSD4_9FUNG|nr:hypothetical protein KI688_003919 [Linnemannia hyalina]
MSGPSRSSSASRASRYREPTDPPSPNIPDEGYYEQRTEVPKWALQLSEEQRAELAIQLLQSVSPMVFSRAYARLTPLLQHRDFLAELPYELTVHLLSYLDERSLMNVALVSKEWNRFASDNAVWKGIYIRHGWAVNQDMIDWYLKGSELEMASIALEREQEQEHEDRVIFAARSAVSNGKRRKVVDIDPKDDAAERSGDDYDMLQDITTPYERYPEEEGDRKLHRFSPTQFDPEHQTDIDAIETLTHAPSDPPTIAYPDPEPPNDNLFSYVDIFQVVKILWTPEERFSGPATTRITGSSCIDFIGSQAPYPSQFLTPEILQAHRDPISGRATINWKYLCMQRKLLEKNWTQGVHLARELPGHTEGIYCIQFDGYKVISGSRDTTIKIWDIRSGECVRTYSGHTASVLCLQYDDTRIVSGSSDTSILVWDLETGQILQRLNGHIDSVLSVRFEKDIVVSCSKDRSVKIWKISSGQLLRTLRGHRAAVNAVQFSPESAAPSPFRGNPRLVVSASGDKTIKVWSFETGECLRTLEGHARGIACIQFEGNVVVSGSSDQSIKIWDLSTGACINTLAGHEGLVRTLQFAGGRIISGSYDETIKIWDQATGNLLTDLGGRHSHRVFKLQFDDSKIVSCSQDQKVAQIIIWDFADGVDTTFLN